jgi:hypothetical protein
MALNKINPSKIIKVCSLQDEAIDKETTGKENIEVYETTYDFSLLKFKEGTFPTIFHVSNVLASEEAKIKQAHFKVDFPDIKDLSPDQLKNISYKDMKPKVTQINSQEMVVKYFNAAVKKYEENGVMMDCNADAFPFSIVQEIGSFVMIRTQLGDELKNA